MLAQLYVALPYRITILTDQALTPFEHTYDGYLIRFMAPVASGQSVHEDEGEEIVINGMPAYSTDTLRIDFQRESFSRSINLPVDPPEDVIAHAINYIHARLRYVIGGASVIAPSFPNCMWRIDYCNDDGTELIERKGEIRTRGVLMYTFAWNSVTPEAWQSISQLPSDFAAPAWNSIRLDALNALPAIGTAVVLAATSLEVFIAKVLDCLAASSNLPPELWTWITDRGGDVLRQPSVEDQFDVLLANFTGHSLKEQAGLWESFVRLKKARNSFVHTGIALVGGREVTVAEASELVQSTAGITAIVQDWLPEQCRWPRFTHDIKLEMKKKVKPFNPPGQARK